MSYDSFCADVAKLYPITGSLSEGAPPAPLGMKQRIPATATGFTHGYVVTATGVLAGSARFDSSNAYDAAVHSSFGLGAQEGEQLWTLVANNTGSTIQRGTALVWAGGVSNLYYVQPAPTSVNPAEVIGVAQFDIPTSKAAYILAKGKGKVLVAAAAGVSLGDGLVIDAGTAGTVETEALATDTTLGIALANAGASTLVDALLNCTAG